MRKIKFTGFVSFASYLLLLLLSVNAFAIRNAPVTTAPAILSCPSLNVVIPITVTGFTSICAVTLRIDYDPTVATYISYVGHPALTGLLVNSVSISPTLSKIMIVWSDAIPKTLAATDTLVKITMNYISGSTTLFFNNTAGGGSECEYADETGNPMNDIPTSTYYLNGAINTLAVGIPGSITGTSALCAGTNGVTYSIAPVTNATGYNWVLPSGFTIATGSNTNSITADVSTSASSGDITVTPNNVCGSGSASPPFPVTVNPLPEPTIAGPASVCVEATGVTYTTESGMTGYTWAISSGGTITAGLGTNQITVTWNTTGAQTVSVNYTNTYSCNAVSPTVKNITVNPLPVPTVTGSAIVCAGSTGVTYSTESSMSGYIWSISSGGTITSGSGTNQITVTWNIAGAQTVNVNYTNSAGCTASVPTTYPVTVNPQPIPTITGPSNVCVNSTDNTYNTETGMTDYNWSVTSGGTITAGAGTNAITVTWNTAGIQSVSVNYMNSFGCTASTATNYSVTVNPLPADAGAIAGSSEVCQQTNGVIYFIDPIPDATGYSWTVPQGASIVNGADTPSITVDFTATAESGDITVQGTNSCGEGTSSNLYITVNPTPNTPVIQSNGDTLWSDMVNGNQWYYEGNMIPGATNQTYIAEFTGWYWCNVTLNGCPSDTSNNIYITITGINELPEASVIVYPIPNNGKFTVSIATTVPHNFTILIYDWHAEKIYYSSEINVYKNFEQKIDLRPIPSGVYTLLIRNAEHRIIRRVLVNK